MILLCGIPSETPLAMVREELGKLSEHQVMINQRQFATMENELEIAEGHTTGWLRQEGCSWRLEDFRGIFLRLMDDRELPEVKDEPPASAKRQYCRALHETLMRWCEVTPA